MNQCCEGTKKRLTKYFSYKSSFKIEEFEKKIKNHKFLSMAIDRPQSLKFSTYSSVVFVDLL